MYSCTTVKACILSHNGIANIWRPSTAWPIDMVFFEPHTAPTVVWLGRLKFLFLWMIGIALSHIWGHVLQEPPQQEGTMSSWERPFFSSFCQINHCNAQAFFPLRFFPLSGQTTRFSGVNLVRKPKENKSLLPAMLAFALHWACLLVKRRCLMVLCWCFHLLDSHSNSKFQTPLLVHFYHNQPLRHHDLLMQKGKAVLKHILYNFFQVFHVFYFLLSWLFLDSHWNSKLHTPFLVCVYHNLLLHTSDESRRGESGKDELEPLRVVLQSCPLHCTVDSSFYNKSPRIWLNSTLQRNLSITIQLGIRVPMPCSDGTNPKI